jgi:hypothetical protein
VPAGRPGFTKALRLVRALAQRVRAIDAESGRFRAARDWQ